MLGLKLPQLDKAYRLKGVQPSYHKQDSLDRPLGNLIPSEFYYIPTRDKQGNPLKLKCKVGARVLGGQELNELRHPNEMLYLAPTSGVISAVEELIISSRVPYHSECLKLRADGKDEFLSSPPVADHNELSYAEIIERIKAAAVYGMGGAGFPAWLKLHSGKFQHLIVNAVECESYITADEALINAASVELATAIRLLQDILAKHNAATQPAEQQTALKTYVAMEANQGAAISKLQQSLAAQQTEHLEVKVLPTIYPSGSEKQLVQSLLNKTIPSGQVATQHGIVCQNVATVYAIYNAVVKGEPLLKRVVTISGSGVAQPQNYWVRIGTPISSIMQHLGLGPELQVFLGGGMMNYLVHDTRMPLHAAINCLLFFPQKHKSSSKKFYLRSGRDQPILDQQITSHRECIRCGLCEQVCPVDILPQELYRYIRAGKLDLAEAAGQLSTCIECAACDYICPSDIPLSDYYVFAKEQLKSDKQDKYKADRARTRFDNHKLRLERQQQELAARRAARRAALQNTNASSPLQAQEDKQRKINSLRLQIAKTKSGIIKWQQAADEQKAASLQQVLQKLEAELQELL